MNLSSASRSRPEHQARPGPSTRRVALPAAESHQDHRPRRQVDPRPGSCRLNAEGTRSRPDESGWERALVTSVHWLEDWRGMRDGGAGGGCFTRADAAVEPRNGPGAHQLARPAASCWRETSRHRTRVASTRTAIITSTAARGDDASGRLQPGRDGVVAAPALVVALLPPGQQEHLVVRGRPEGEHEDHDGTPHLDGSEGPGSAAARTGDRPGRSTPGPRTGPTRSSGTPAPWWPPSGSPLPQLIAVLPRCRHDSHPPWIEASTRTRGRSRCRRS